MSTSHIVLEGSHRPAVPLDRVGSPDPNETIELTLKLRRKTPLPDVAERPTTPMTVAELDRTYGASEADANAVQSALEPYGLTVSDFSPSARSVKIKGTIQDVERAFRPNWAIYRGHMSNFRARDGHIEVPTPISGIVESIFGLDQRKVANRRSMVIGERERKKKIPTTQAPPLKPSDIENRYGFPPGSAAGQTIGILEFGGAFVQADLDAYCQNVNKPVAQVRLVGVGVTPETAYTQENFDAAGEVMLDVEIVAGLCPGSTIVLYFSTFDEKGWVDVLDAAVHDQTNSPHVLSISWGLAEDATDWSAGAIKAINEALKEAALVGMTVCVASGDDGSGDEMADNLAHVDFPSSSPFVLGVGGTLIAQGVEETWRAGHGIRDGHGGGATGGGVSVQFPLPAWQSSVAVASANPGSGDGRVVPDVSALAGAPGHFMVFDNRPVSNGGTSASAPVWAALIARINEKLPADKRCGYITPVLYQSAGASTVGAQGCNDITIGNNVSDPSPGFGYTAGNGFDAVTGWGTPNGNALLGVLRQIL